METIEERDYYVKLFEKYGDLLPQSQKQALQLLLYEDLSYGELAQELAMSRPGAYDAVKKAKLHLKQIDEKLKHS